MRPSRVKRGSSLLTVLILLTLIVALTFAVLIVARNGTIIAGKTNAKEQAQNAADAVIAMALSKLKEGNVDFHQDLSYQASPDTIGTLTFNQELGEPYSLNNLVSNSKEQGWNGTTVPPKFCHLVAVGEHHGYRVIRHAMVKDPPYPYSLASAGAITGERMEVYGIESLEAAADGVISDDEKQPGHIVSNATTGQSDPNAIVLGSGTSISGDVKARGPIDLSGGATVQGKVLPNAAQQNLPDVSVEAFDPAGKTGEYAWTGAPGPDNGPPQLVGRARYSGDLTIDDLDMAEGLLYVDGDVTVTGTVKGKGAIVATGKITVTGSMDAESDHAALVAKGDIKIHGDGPNSSKFQGLVYSEGSIDIARTKIMGAAVSKDTAGTTKLEDVVAVAVPELTEMKMEIHATLEKAKESAGQAMKTSIGGGEPDPIGIRAPDGSFTELAPNPDTAGLKELGAQLGDLPSEPRAWDLVVEEKSGVLNPNPSGAIGGIDFNDAFGEFLSYVDEHRNHNVQIVDVFQLDLNTLISLEVELEMMYHTTVMTR